jgi:hypothetical protein
MHNIVRTATYRSHKLATLTCRHFVSRWFEQRNSATLQVHLHQHPIAPVSLPLDGTVNHMVNRIEPLCVGCADMFPPNLGSVWGVADMFPPKPWLCLGCADMFPPGCVQESDGEVLRLPVMSKKMTMAGELEVTGSVAGGVQPVPQVGQ